MADTYAIAANALKLLLDTTYAADGFVAVHDELHESLGWDGVYLGIAPIRQVPAPGNRTTQHTLLHVQFFGLWDKEVDPALELDPRIITGYHDRLLVALKSANITVSGDVWFFQWEGTEFPRDPIGNKSRFVADIRVWSNNHAQV